MTYQRQNWTSNESGILRKKDEPEEELLIFGYSCKLFRDDEKALYIDQGKHLIPWMGDESLRIDRYDVRGALYDLTPYESVSGKHEDTWLSLSTEERKIEHLCDEERYRALTHNEDEEALYQEEELKRLHQALGSDKEYGQVGYTYDEDKNGSNEKVEPEKVEQPEEVDEPFIAPPELDIPQGMVLPETVKLNVIIEKTAVFINQQGTQMEILLKMKQSNNPQFDFLSFNSVLHPYYRHLLTVIKAGRYKPRLQKEEEQKEEEEDEDLHEQDYLHHTLATSSSIDVAPLIPSINYKPSADCAYSMLVNKIKGKQNQFSLMTPSKIEEEIQEPQYEGTNTQYEFSSSPKMYDLSYVPVTEESSSPVPVTKPVKRRKRKRQQGGFVYNDEELDPEPPPQDIQLIIDKMAKYVAKNGRDFEVIVRNKGDPRFNFLDTSSQYYNYYCKQLEHFENTEKPPVVPVIIEVPTQVPVVEKPLVEDYKTVTETGDDKSQKPTPVCFSIKKPKETESKSLENRSALPVEESSGDDEEKSNNETYVSEDSQGVRERNATEKWAEERTKSKLISVAKEKLITKEKEKQVDKEKEKQLQLEKEKEKLLNSEKEKERQLQLERKRKAAAFLNSLQRIKSRPPRICSPIPEPEEKPVAKIKVLEEPIEIDDDSDTDSDSSAPSSVTSPEVQVVSHKTVPEIQSKKLDSMIASSITSSLLSRLKNTLTEKFTDEIREESERKRKKRKRSPSKHRSSHSRSHRRDPKHRKHRRRRSNKERHSNREHDEARRKHYKSKKHKKKEKKHVKSSSSGDSDSD